MPIVAVLLLMGVAIYAIQAFNLENMEAVYTYKDKLFDEEAVAIIDITMADEDWVDILANLLEEAYKEASIF